MIHSLLLLIATKPQLLAEHAEAHVELMAAEIGNVSAAWTRRAMLNAVALCGLGVGAVLAGVALMLWAVTPAVTVQALSALMAAPYPCALSLDAVGVKVQCRERIVTGVPSTAAR